MKICQESEDNSATIFNNDSQLFVVTLSLTCVWLVLTLLHCYNNLASMGSRVKLPCHTPRPSYYGYKFKSSSGEDRLGRILTVRLAS